jgi:cytochrome c-type biogenesis protein CcmH
VKRIEPYLWAICLVFLLGAASSAWSREAAPAAADPALEKRTMALANQLRCLVCQNQTIADSNAPLAVDLKNQIREQLSKGASDSAIVDFMVARYGDFVLYRPPFRPATALLWLGPLLLVLAGLLFLFQLLRRRAAAAEPELSAAERQQAQALLSEQPPPRPSPALPRNKKVDPA